MSNFIKFYSDLNNIKDTNNIKSFLHFHTLDNVIDDIFHISEIVQQLQGSNVKFYRFNDWFIFSSQGEPRKILVESVKEYILREVFREGVNYGNQYI